MGVLDSVLGGGSETVETNLPAYVQDPSRYIGSRTNALLRNQNQRGFNPFQAEGFGDIIGAAQQGNPFLGGNTNFIQGLFNNGGLNQQQGALANTLTTGGYVNPAMAETQRIAMGGDVGQNPWLQQAFNRSADVVGENFQNNILANMDNSFAQRGRSGSRAYAKSRNTEEDAYGRQINDLANSIFGGQYNADMQSKNQALSSLGGLGQQDVTNRLAGAGLFQQGTGNQFSGVQASGAVNDMRYGDAERLFQAGQTLQDQPWRSLNMGADVVGKLAYPTQQTQSQNLNPFSQLIGLGTSAAGAFAPYYQANQMRQ